MKKFFFLMVAALMSLTMMAGTNDLLWDYTENKIPTSGTDKDAVSQTVLTYGSYVNDAPSSGNGYNGVKIDSKGYAYFKKAAVAGKLKLTYGPRTGNSSSVMAVYTWSGATPAAETIITKTKSLTESGTDVIELTAEQNNIYICRPSDNNTQSVLQKIQFVEEVARTFVDFELDLQTAETMPAVPEGVEVNGTYNSSKAPHGYLGFNAVIPVDGTVKFTIGGCEFANNPSVGTFKNKAGEIIGTVDVKSPKCYHNGGTAQFVYLGEADTLTYIGAEYTPYFKAEAAEIMPCVVIFKDQNGTEIARQETYEGATLGMLPEESALPAIGEGNVFRGWFYANGRKAKVGDPINGNTTIQAKVTPIEVATEGSVLTYGFTDQTFYPEDHELVSVSNGAFYDSQHGWNFAADGSISVYSPGTSVIVVTLCKYSETGTVNVTSGFDGRTIASAEVVKNETPDGTELVAQYSSGPAWVTISWTAKQYIHKVVVYNVETFMEKDETTGYYIVPAGDAASLILAIVQAENGDKIFLPNGLYDLGETCLTTISKNNISLVGQSMDGVIIKNAPAAAKESIDKTATIKINKEVSGTYLQDLTIQNALDYYKNDNGRAVCLWDQGTKTVCKNVKLLSYQDTYYSNLQGAVKYFEDCEIHGTVDFICGDGSVYFKNNLLYCEKRKKDGGGSDALTANNGVASDKGYVFEGCTVMSECPVVSFGRAWNNTPQVAFLNTKVDYSAGEFAFKNSDIERWTKKLMNANAWPKFGEYNTCTTDGTLLTPNSNVVTFMDEKSGNATQNIETVLSAEKAATYTMAYTLGSWASMAETEAKQAEVDLNNIDAEGIYLAENPNGYYEVLLGSMIGTDWSQWGEKDMLRKANGRGGFGPAVCPRNPQQAIDNTEVSNKKVTKTLRNGQVVIVRDGRMFNMLGAEYK